MKKNALLLLLVFLSVQAYSQIQKNIRGDCDPVPWLNAEILENGDFELTWDYPQDTNNITSYFLGYITYFNPCEESSMEGIFSGLGTFHYSILNWTFPEYYFGHFYVIRAKYDSCQSEFTYSNFVVLDSTWYNQEFDLTVNVSLEDGNNPEGADVKIDGRNCYYDNLFYNNLAEEDGETLFDGVMHGTYDIVVSKSGYHTAVVEDFYLNQDSTINVELKVFYVGLEEKVETANISIYPNPATSQFTVESNSEIRKIELINLVGETVFEKNSIGLSETIQTSGLKPGIYFIRIKTETGQENRRVILTER